MITITNKTIYPQDIHTFDGKTISVSAESSVDIDEKEFFPEELERMKLFFKVSEKEVQKVTPRQRGKYESENGGTE